MSLRGKLLLPLIFLVLAFALFLFLYWHPSLLQESRSDYLRSQQQQLMSLGIALRDPLLRHDLAQVQMTLDDLSQEHSGWLSISLTDPEGRPLYLHTDRKGVSIAESGVQLRHEIRNLDEMLAILELAVSLAPVEQAATALTSELILLVAALFLLAALISAPLMERQIGRPLSMLAIASQRLAKGDFDAELPAEDSGEIGKVVTSFRAMRDHMGAYQRELEQAAERSRRITQQIAANNALLSAVSEVQESYISHAPRAEVFNEVLLHVLALTDSEYGYIGEVRYDAEGSPYLHTLSCSNVSWDEVTRRRYDDIREKGLPFRCLDSLFDAVFKNGEVVIANDPENDSRCGDLAPGHPPFSAFLGLPLPDKERLIGVIGVANRPGGYSQELVSRLAPLLQAIANLFEGYRLKAEQETTTLALQNLVKGTSAVTGPDFFYELVCHLARALKMRYALVGEVVGTQPERIRTLAVWAGETFGENMEYVLAGTPCETVVGKALCIYPRGVRQRFPADRLLVEMGAESYVGAPLFDRFGKALGVLAVLHDSELHDEATAESIMAVFASRAGAEMERIQAEQALRESEQKFRAVFDNAIDGILVADVQTKRFVSSNPTICQMLGYSREELVQLGIDDIHPGQVLPYAHAQFEKHYRGEAALTSEIPVKRKDGDIIYVDIAASRARIGGKDFLIGLFRDITERKKAQEALKASEQRFRQLAESINEVFWLITPDWEEILYISPAYEAIWGNSCESLYREPLSWLRSVHPEDHARVEAYLESKRAGDLSDIRFPEYRIVRRDGETRWIAARAFPIRNAQGEVYRIAGIAEDITERKLVAAELERQKSLFEAVFRDVPDAMVLTNTEGEIILCNPALTRVFGYQPADIKGQKTLALYESRKAFDRQGRIRFHLDAQEQDKPYVVNYRRKNGEVFPGETVGTPIKDGHGTTLGFIGVIRDISERVEAEEKLRQSAAVFENTAEGVMITDPRQRILAVNRAFTDITGYAPAEVTGQRPSLLSSGRQDKPFYASMWASLERTGQWQGEIWNRRKDGEVYPQWLNISTVRNDSGAVTNYVGVFSDISSIKRSEERLEFLAHHDSLTGLPNRLLFNGRLQHALERARRDGGKLAVLFLDLDRFKNVNDSLGHPIGDEVLRQVTERLAGIIRVEDTLARLGGDEFILLMEGVRQAQEAAVVAQKLVDLFRRPFHVSEQDMRLTLSIGISLFPDDGDEVATLVRNADAALYHAKEAGRDNFQFYTSELTTSAFERLTLENALRRALEHDEFVLDYQPQISLATGQVIGLEALIRWQHPEQGRVAPSQFIPVAEESGLIVAIGEWVLHTACRDAQAWITAGCGLERIAVNVAGPQIQRGDLVAVVGRVLEETGLEPRHLELEVTENFIMHRAEQAIDILDKLKAIGVKMSIDDFGTGYSSLSYLKRLPIDTLKIDQSFVQGIPRDPGDESIARAVIALGHSLQLNVIAEGVETSEQAAFLQREGCNEGQGYLYSRPVSAHEVERLFKQQRFDA